MKINIYLGCVLFSMGIFMPKPSFSQHYLTDSTQVDSITLVNHKAILNALSTELFEKHVFYSKGSSLPYRLLKPKNYDSSKKYPLIITFHNSVRIGDDNEKQLEPLARIWLLENNYAKYNCFVLAPQFASRSAIYEEGTAGIMQSKPSGALTSVLELIALIQETYPIDSKQLYLLGYSMGGSTAQHVMALKPTWFAGLISIAGTPDLSNVEAMSRKKILLIHGEKDKSNAYLGSKILFEKLPHNQQLTFVNYPYLDHDNIVIPLLLSDFIPSWIFQK